MEAKFSVKSAIVKEENEYGDELMDTSDNPLDLDEGEIQSSDDDEDVRTPAPSHYVVDDALAKNSRNFVTGIDIFDRKENIKRSERAKRFALNSDDINGASSGNETLLNLHKSLGIDRENERHYRFNAIHMRGTENMNTDDVFQYFLSYAPTNVEWINDLSCNVVWLDDVSAARAMLCLSKEIKNLDKIHANGDPFKKDFEEEIVMDDSSVENEAVDARQIKAAIPPGYWRLGVPSSKSSVILLRYANRSDKKHRHAERNSLYYKKYSNPHFDNTPGIISKSHRDSRFRILKKHEYRSQDSYILPPSDNSEDENSDDMIDGDRKNPWGELAQTWSKIDKFREKNTSEVRSRVAVKRPRSEVTDLRLSLNDKKSRIKTPNDLPPAPVSSDEESHWENKVKVPRMKMYADVEEEREKRKEKKTYATRVNTSPARKPVQMEDLRSKLGKKKNNQLTVLRGAKSRGWVAEEEDEKSDVSSNGDEKDSGDWALEHYHDLRESLEQSKKEKAKRTARCEIEDSENEEEEEEEEQDDDDDYFDGDLGKRSPLQIEIDNDEYYREKDSDSSE